MQHTVLGRAFVRRDTGCGACPALPSTLSVVLRGRASLGIEEASAILVVT